MLGGTLALLNRSLRTDDRSLPTHLFRLLFVGITYALLVSTHSTSIFFGAPGLIMFQRMCYLNFFCISLAAVSFFATAITEEKEDMTLGLLKMAGISPLGLLLGKAMPRLIGAMVLLSVQLPFTMLAITLGGVSLQQVLAAYFALLAYLVFVANLGLFYSVICLQSRNAGVYTGTFLGVYFFGPFIVGMSKRGLIFNGYLTRGGLIDRCVENALLWTGSTSAFRRLRAILQTGFDELVFSFQVFTNVAAGVAFLLLAWLVFERCTRNEKPASEPRGLLFKRIGFRGALGPNRAWSAALIWKDFHFTAGGKMMIVSKFVLYALVMGLIIWVSMSAGGRMRLEEFGQALMSLGMMAFVVETGVHASRVFYTEVKWRTLSTLALLPKSMGEIAYAKLAGCAYGLIPASTFFLAGVVCAPDSFGDVLAEIVDEPGVWYMFSQYFVFLHLAAFLSLFVKWGAFPLAVAAIYVGNALFISMFIRGPDEAIFILLGFFAMVACVVFQFLIGSRLKTLAAS